MKICLWQKAELGFINALASSVGNGMGWDGMGCSFM